MPKRIVLIEDNPDNAEIIRINLEDEGFKVHVEHDGAKGLEAIRKEKPDGIILDIMVPRMNGYEVCAALQQDERMKKIPIMILTALTSGNQGDQDADWRDRLEVAEFMSKPFDSDELVRRIKRMLGE